MIKRILFPIAGSSSVESGLGSAFTLAKNFSAQVDVIFCRRSFELEVPVDADGLSVDWSSDVTKEFERNEKRRVSLARKTFDELTAKFSIPYQQYAEPDNLPAASWEVSKRHPTIELSIRSGAMDMVVVGRSTDSVGDMTRLLAETALFECGLPVFVASRSIPATIGKRILIGWNRSAPAARAVRNAMPFLQQAEMVTLFMVTTGAKEGTEPDEVIRFLSLHGVKADLVEAPNTSTRVSEHLLNEAKNFNADLLVMGAFSHSRIRELILGGVTRDILGNAGIPVLMSR